MKKLVALVAGIAFSLGIGLAIPQTFAQTPAPKEEKKGEMDKTDKDKMEKKGEKKAAAKKKKSDKMDKDRWTRTRWRRRKKRSSAPATQGRHRSRWRPSAAAWTPGGAAARLGFRLPVEQP